jgi:hypothetical protein
VIQNLLVAITQLLQDELSGQPISVSLNFVASPVTEPKGSQLPLIAIYPGNWTIAPHTREDRLKVRGFQQAFRLDIYDQTFAATEQWASLATGILIARHDNLIEQFNHSIVPPGKSEYQSKHWITTHQMVEFKPLSGTCLYPKTGMGLQLEFTATGQITVMPTVAEDDNLIRKVTINDLLAYENP